MNKIFLLASSSLILFGCMPGQQQDQIIVDGEASLEFVPDTFSISASIRSRSEAQQAALETIANVLADTRETLPQLEALTHLQIESSGVELKPIQESECLETAGYNQEELCPVAGYFGSVSLKIKGSPASSAGQALSLLSQLGAEQVRLTGYSLNEVETAQREALDAAVKDARAKATEIASAAGATLSGPIRIQYGDGFGEEGYGSGMLFARSPERITVSASRVLRPEIDLDLEPRPIRINAKIVAAFAIE